MGSSVSIKIVTKLLFYFWKIYRERDETEQIIPNMQIMCSKQTNKKKNNYINVIRSNYLKKAC